MKRAVFFILLPLLATTALAAPPAPSLTDYLRVQLQDGRLGFILSGMPEVDPERSTSSIRIFTGELHDVPGTATLYCSPGRSFSASIRRADGDQTVSDTLSIATSVTTSRTQLTHSVTEIKTQEGVTISSVVQSVQLMLPAITPLGPSTTGTCTLRVNEGTKNVVTVSEKSFAELWTKHPDEVNKYLKPLFESLDLQGVFSIHADQAARVFAPLLKGLPDVKSQVEALLPKLNDDSSAVRSAASAELDTIGPNALPIINAMDLKSLPLQTRITLKSFVEHLKNSPAIADNRLENPDFLLLCLAVDDPQIPALAKKQLERVTGKPLDFDEKASLTDRQTAIEKLRLSALAKQATP